MYVKNVYSCFLVEFSKKNSIGCIKFYHTYRTVSVISTRDFEFYHTRTDSEEPATAFFAFQFSPQLSPISLKNVLGLLEHLPCFFPPPFEAAQKFYWFLNESLNSSSLDCLKSDRNQSCVDGWKFRNFPNLLWLIVLSRLSINRNNSGDLMTIVKKMITKLHEKHAL